MALTTDTLRTTLAAALEWSEPEVGAYLAALQARGALPAGDAVLGAGDIVVVLLAFVSGSPPAEAVNETLRLIGFEHRGFCQRSDRAGQSAIEWTETPPMVQMPATALGAVLSELILAMRAGAAWLKESAFFQIRRARAPGTDLVLIESRHRNGDDVVLSGCYFTPAVIPTAPIGALATRAERTLSWQLVEHLAELLGPAEADDTPDAEMTTGEAARAAVGMLN